VSDDRWSVFFLSFFLAFISISYLSSSRELFMCYLFLFLLLFYHAFFERLSVPVITVLLS
jgi:hypothetical protein